MKKILLLTIFLISQIGVFASTINGIANLENHSDHSGINILFVANSLTAQTDSTVSNPDGSYSINLQNGIYNILYTKEGFDAFKIENYLLVGNDSLSTITLLQGPFKDISGHISGTFYNDTIYLVTGNIEVNNDDTLRIEAGTKIKFKGFYSLTINGTISAKGTENDKILFTSGLSNPTKGDWNNIIFSLGSNPQSIFSNCIVEFGGMSEPDNVDNRYSMMSIYSSITIDSCIVRESAIHALYIFDGFPTISNCQVYNNNRSGIYSYNGRAIIKNNTVHNNGWQGIRNNVANTEISGNIIYKNNGGIICFNSATIERNIIYNNYEYGLDIEFCAASVSNNTITGNYQDGIMITRSTDVVASSNIISDNQGYGLSLNETCTSITIKYNLIYGNNSGVILNAPLGVGSNVSTNSNGTDCDAYFNIFNNPLFENQLIDNPLFLHLQNSSPCINAGDPALPKDEDLSVTDIGAISNLIDSTIVKLTTLQHSVSIYPNPTSGTLYINTVNEITSIRIYNISGKVVFTTSTILTPIDVSALENGIYTIQFSGKNYIQSRKFIKY